MPQEVGLGTSKQNSNYAFISSPTIIGPTYWQTNEVYHGLHD